MKIVLFIYLFVHFFIIIIIIIIIYDHKRKYTKALVRDHLTALRQMKSISQRRNNCWKRKIMSCEGYETGRKEITTMKPFISYSKRGCDSPDSPRASSLFCYRRVCPLVPHEQGKVYRVLSIKGWKRSVVHICGISIFIFVFLKKVA